MATVIKPDNNEYTVLGNMTVSGNLLGSGSFDLTNSLNILSSDNINLSAPVNGAGALNVTGGAYIGNDLYVDGTLVVNGDIITLGNSQGSITFGSNISSNVVPSTTSTYNLGSNTSQWNNTYTNVLSLGSVDESSEDIVSAIASVSTSVSIVDSNTQALVTLPNGTPGQIKTFIANNPTSPVQITPSTSLGYTSFVLTNTGDSVTLIYRDVIGWVITSTFRSSII